jgi:hypothetical protein
MRDTLLLLPRRRAIRLLVVVLVALASVVIGPAGRPA